MSSSLNSQQLDAVKTTEGPVLIIAGAGSGKTRVITHRIAYLISEKNIPAYNILAITFTNKAADEMRNRVFKLLNLPIPKRKGLFLKNAPNMGTFHSICAQILRLDGQVLGYKSTFTIYDSSDQKAAIKRILKKLNLDPKQFPPESVLHFISGAKNELISAKDYGRYASSYFQEIVEKVYLQYEELLKKQQAMDFDDLLLKTVELFQKHQNILEKYQQKFQYILVDEYQDTNKPQYKMIKMLAQRHKNICVVGDDAQSIYGWRGADFRNLLGFEKDYPNAKVIKLEQNYRSTKSILDAANSLIKNNMLKKEKNLWTDNEKGDNLIFYKAKSEVDEAEYVVRKIKEIMEQDTRHKIQDTNKSQVSNSNNQSSSKFQFSNKASEALDSRFVKTSQDKQVQNDKIIPNTHYPLPITNFSDFVVLYRTNAQSRALEDAFIRYGVSYKIIGGLKFYQRKEIKDIVAYLRIIYNSNDIVSLERIINEPRRGITEATFSKILNIWLENIGNQKLLISEINKIENITPKAKSSILRFLEIYNLMKSAIKKLNLDELIEYVAKASGYKDHLLNNKNNDLKIENEARWENILELKSVAEDYINMPTPNALAAFLEEVSLMSDIDQYESDSNSVVFMTAHNAKGLEFDTVFVVGMEEGLFPHSRSLLEPAQMEEERRLCYVAVTRAKKRLFLLSATSRTYFGQLQTNQVSRFIYEIPKELIEEEKFGMACHSGPQSGISGAKTAGILNQVQDDKKYIKLRPGDKVIHEVFGEGIVVKLNGTISEIAFSNYGLKKIAIDLAPIKKIS